MPSDGNCLLHALRHEPGHKPNGVEASNLRANIGQNVMGNLNATTGGSSGESFRQHIARDPASAGVSLPEDYNRHMFRKQSRVFWGTLEIQAFVKFIEPGRHLLIFAWRQDSR